MNLDVPVKNYVKCLMLKHYGKEPIQVRANSDLGQIFMLSIVNANYLNVTFGFKGDALPARLDLNGVVEDAVDHVVDMPRDLVSLRFELGGKFNKALIAPDVLVQIGKCMESYFRIYMKGFSQGYRSIFNSERHSALVFHELFDFDEEVFSRDNAEKIVQRETREMRDPIMGVRKSYRESKR